MAKKNEKPLAIEVEEAKIVLELEGMSALLMHSPAAMMIQERARASKAKASDIPKEEDAELRCYRAESGQLMFPAMGPRNSILQAAKAYKTGRRSWSTQMAHMRPEDEWMLLYDEKDRPIKEYEIDSRRVVIRGSGAIIRHRPLVFPWIGRVTFIYDKQLIPDPDIFRVIGADAGSRIGVGDFRPEKRGWFGRFKVRILEG